MGFSHVSMVLEIPRGDLQAYQDAPVKGHLSPSGNCTMYGLGLRLVKGYRTGISIHFCFTDPSSSSIGDPFYLDQVGSYAGWSCCHRSPSQVLRNPDHQGWLSCPTSTQGTWMLA